MTIFHVTFRRTLYPPRPTKMGTKDKLHFGWAQKTPSRTTRHLHSMFTGCSASSLEKFLSKDIIIFVMFHWGSFSFMASSSLYCLILQSHDSDFFVVLLTENTVRIILVDSVSLSNFVLTFITFDPWLHHFSKGNFSISLCCKTFFRETSKGERKIGLLYSWWMEFTMHNYLLFQGCIYDYSWGISQPFWFGWSPPFQSNVTQTSISIWNHSQRGHWLRLEKQLSKHSSIHEKVLYCTFQQYWFAKNIGSFRFNRESVKEGFKAVKGDQLEAFIYDATVLEYLVGQDDECNVLTVGSWYAMTGMWINDIICWMAMQSCRRKVWKFQFRIWLKKVWYNVAGYGVAFPKNSMWIPKFNEYLMRYRENGDLERMQRFWFTGACEPRKRRRTSSKPLALAQVSIISKTICLIDKLISLFPLQFMSAFLLLALGITFSGFLLLCEHSYFRYLRKYLAHFRNTAWCNLISIGNLLERLAFRPLKMLCLMMRMNIFTFFTASHHHSFLSFESRLAVKIRNLSSLVSLLMSSHNHISF